MENCTVPTSGEIFILLNHKEEVAFSPPLFAFVFFYFQFKVLRNGGTESAFSSEFDKSFKEGVYNCAACETPLYKSGTKFKVSYSEYLNEKRR